MIDIEKGNAYIAKFMGGTFEEREIMTVGGVRKGKWTFADNMWCYDDQLDYHCDWNRLMTVVQKIEKIAPTRVIIDCNQCRIVGDKRFKVHTMKKINSVYLCCLQFIEWYDKH